MKFLNRHIRCIKLNLFLTFATAINAVAVPIITITGSPSSVSTTYGTPSSSTSFMVSGTGMVAGILVTPPPGFEVSIDGVNFAGTVTVNGIGTIAPTTVYIRLKQTTAASTYSGPIVLSSPGASDVNLPMPASTVSQAQLIIVVSGSKIYGDTFSDFVATTSNFNFSSLNTGLNGLKNGETVSSLNISITGGSAATDPVGVYKNSISTANITGANGFLLANYNVTYQNGPLTVTPAPLTITADNVSKTFGSVLTGGAGSTAFTTTGLKNSETVSTVTITYGAGAAAVANTGTYNTSVIPTAATGGTFNPVNYTINYQAGNITVTPAPLTVTADNKSKIYGDINPPLTITYTGFVNSDGIAQLTMQPTAITTATQASHVGQYPIIVSGGIASNYTFGYVNGILTVNLVPSANIYIPNTFTPNGDGINDTWDINNLNTYSKVTVEILNRYGTRVYFSNNYAVPWDGRYNGAKVPEGTYYYIITGVSNKPLTGYVAVIR